MVTTQKITFYLFFVGNNGIPSRKENTIPRVYDSKNFIYLLIFFLSYCKNDEKYFFTCSFCSDYCLMYGFNKINCTPFNLKKKCICCDFNNRLGQENSTKTSKNIVTTNISTIINSRY